MKLITLSKTGNKNKGKYFAKVDNEDFEWLSKFNWYAHIYKTNHSYAQRTIHADRGNYQLLMHREIMKHHGLLNESKLIDHMDGDGLNNQKSNLRSCSVSQNNANRKPCGTSRYLGVSREGKNRWRAQLGIRAEVIYLGSYLTEADAALAYNEAAQKYHGEFARLNQIELK